MKYCPLWSIVSQTTNKKPCIGRECGMYGICNPFAAEQEEKAKEESQELRVFGGGNVKSKD